MATPRPILVAALAVLTAGGPAWAAGMGCRCPVVARATAAGPAAPCCGMHARCSGAECCAPAGHPGPAACGCPVCDCGTPAEPQPAVPVPPTADELAAQATAPAAPLFLLPPVTAGHHVRPAFAAGLPPPDLVITLSRLTC